MDRRFTVYNPEAGLAISNDMKLVNVQNIARTAIEEARITRFAAQDIYESPSIVNHTTGVHTSGSTPLVNGASQDVTYASSKDTWTQTLITDGWAVSTAVLTEGDKFTIAGVFQVNPRTRQSTGTLQDFVVRALGTSDGSGDLTLTIAPPIIDSGAYRTVTAAPADNAVITPFGTESTAYPQNLALQKDCITLGFAPLDMPVGGADASRQTLDGVSVRLVGDYNIDTDINTWRFDVLFGAKVQNPGFGVRHWG